MTTTTYHTTLSAAALIKKHRGDFSLSLRNDAPLVKEDGTVDEDRYVMLGLSTFVPVSRKVALDVTKRMLTASLEARGCRIPCYTTEYDGKVTLWIGA